MNIPELPSSNNYEFRSSRRQFLRIASGGFAVGVAATLLGEQAISSQLAHRQEAPHNDIPRMAVPWRLYEALKLPADLAPFAPNPDAAETDRSTWTHFGVLGMRADDIQSQVLDRGYKMGVVRWVMPPNELNRPAAVVATIGAEHMTRYQTNGNPKHALEPASSDIYAIGLGIGPSELYATLIGVQDIADSRFAISSLQGVIRSTTTSNAILAEPNPQRRLAIV